MTLLHTEPVVPALDHPTPSAAEALARRVSYAPPQGLDLAGLRRSLDPATAAAPRLLQGTFRVPLGATWTQYRRLRHEKVNAWLRYKRLLGWEWDGRPPIIQPYRYPAFDVVTHRELPGEREMLVSAAFRFKNPKSYRLEIPRDLLLPPKPAGFVARADERQGSAEGGP